MTTIKTPGRVALMAAASVLALSTAVGADTIRFWTTEEQPERLERQQAMAADFTAETGIEVEVIPVTESDLGTRATAAFAAGDLPDVIYHTLQYALPWYEAGILDADAATEVIESLGADTFASGALEMAAVDEGYASVPVDGWTQMIVYRADLFEENGLEPPTTYANVLAAVEALHNPPEMFGFVAATKVDENFMSQVLEHVFLANGVSPGRPRRVPAARSRSDDRGAGILPRHRRGQPRGRALLAAVARALLRGAGGDDHLVALHPRRAGRPARQRAADDQRRPDQSRPGGAHRHRDELRRSLEPDGAAWADIRYFGSRPMPIPRRRRNSSSILDVGRLHRDAGHRARGQVPGAPRRRREPHRLPQRPGRSSTWAWTAARRWVTSTRPR
jgi:multiple sugar transport system substrate-binding protein